MKDQLGNENNEKDNLSNNRPVIIWGTQCTVDHKVHLNAQELRDLLLEYQKRNILGDCRRDFDNIINNGLVKDTEPKHEISGTELDKALQLIAAEKIGKISSELGGSPAISALKEYHLHLNSNQFPKVYFSGIRPASVKDFLKAKNGLSELFRYTPDNDARPQTLGLEVGNYKLMLSCKEGRSLSDLVDKTPEEIEFKKKLSALKSQLRSREISSQSICTDIDKIIGDYENSSKPEIKYLIENLRFKKQAYTNAVKEDYSHLKDLINGSNNGELDHVLRSWYRSMKTNLDNKSKDLETTINSYSLKIKFDSYIQSLRNIINEQAISSEDSENNSSVVIALGGLNKGSTEECQELVSNIQELKTEYQKKGVAVKLFVGTNAFKEDPQEIKAYWNAIKDADILSFNESELNSIYNTIFPGDASISLGEKFCRVGSEFSGVMVCHSAEGAILGAFGNADKILGKSAEELPSFLEKSLQLAVDGTTLALQNGSAPSDAEINFYSQNVRSRQENNFRNRYVHPHEKLANGIVGVYSPNVTYPAGNLVGLGACFDGLLLSYLFRRD